MADFIVDEEVDEDGAPLRFFSSIYLGTSEVRPHVLVFLFLWEKSIYTP